MKQMLQSQLLLSVAFWELTRMDKDRAVMFFQTWNCAAAVIKGMEANRHAQGSCHLRFWSYFKWH